MFKKNINLNKLSTILFYFSIILFIIAFNLAHNPPGGWYQQFMPSLPNLQISDVYFLDSLTGWAVTGNGQPNDTSGYILKTTDGGGNWELKFSDFRDFSRIQFINSITGFVSGGYGTGARIYKSTDAGDNWFTIGIPGGGQIYFDDMSVLNNDTIFVVASNGFVGGVFRTTNGGMNWIQQFSAGVNPDKIYMYNSRIGFIGFNEFSISTKKTTDGGFNWFTVINEGFTDIYFVDSLVGWKCWWERDSIKKSIDGGITWHKQLLPPSGGFFNLSAIEDLSVINRDTLWGVGARGFTTLGFRGLIYKSINGGNTWGYQLPDTNINIGRYSYMQFYTQLTGWAYSIGSGIHTVTGGDTTMTTINHQIFEEPTNFKLKQNYPNPFNPSTIIQYELRITSYIELKLYNALGKEIITLVSKKENAGSYEIKFDGSSLPAGVYFYSLLADGNLIDTKKMILVR